MRAPDSLLSRGRRCLASTIALDCMTGHHIIYTISGHEHRRATRPSLEVPVLAYGEDTVESQQEPISGPRQIAVAGSLFKCIRGGASRPGLSSPRPGAGRKCRTAG